MSTPPGLHAQLGYVHYQMGNVREAVTEFGLEKLLFPESAVFMDRMIEKATNLRSRLNGSGGLN